MPRKKKTEKMPVPIKKKKNWQPTKEEVAQMKVMEEQGYSLRAIARALSRDFKTIKLYLYDHLELHDDPEVQRLMEQIREIEYDDLTSLNWKAKRVLHQRFDDIEKPPTVIEATAVMDRTFNQRESLRKELGKEINPEKIMARIADKERELKELDDELEIIKKKYAGSN